MRVIRYHKLVRDRIPEIIVQSGKTCLTRILTREEYLAGLDAKLDEELAEFRETPCVEELADLLEVLRACACAHGFSMEEVERVRREKAVERGGFAKRIELLEVREA